MKHLILSITIATLLLPIMSHAASDSTGVTFPRFAMPSGWERITRNKRDEREPIVYMRQQFAVKEIKTDGAYAMLSVQKLPAFRGAEMALSDIDGAFENATQLSNNQSLGDWYIPSMSNLVTSTGTLLGHPSREYAFQAEPRTTTYYFRMSYTSFGGNFYALEMQSPEDSPAFHNAWVTMREALNAEKSSSSSSSSSTSFSSSSVSSASSSPMTSLAERTCERVRRWFGDSQTLRVRVNERLLKRFGFSC